MKSLSIIHETSGKQLYILLGMQFVGAILFLTGLIIAQSGATQAVSYAASWFNLVFSSLVGLFLFFTVFLDDYTLGKYRLVLLALISIVTVLLIYDTQDALNFAQITKSETIRTGNFLKGSGSIVILLSLVSMLFHLGTEADQDSADGFYSGYSMRRRTKPTTPILPVMRETIALTPLSPLSPHQLKQYELGYEGNDQEMELENGEPSRPQSSVSRVTSNWKISKMYSNYSNFWL